MNRYDETIVEDLYPLRELLRTVASKNHREHSDLIVFAIHLAGKIGKVIKEFEDVPNE